MSNQACRRCSRLFWRAPIRALGAQMCLVVASHANHFAAFVLALLGRTAAWQLKYAQHVQPFGRLAAWKPDAPSLHYWHMGFASALGAEQPNKAWCKAWCISCFEMREIPGIYSSELCAASWRREASSRLGLHVLHGFSWCTFISGSEWHQRYSQQGWRDIWYTDI